MLEYVKNVMADKETTCEPERNLSTISFCLIPFDMGILMTFQRSSNSYLFPYGTDLNWLDIIRIPRVICGRSSSHIFFQNKQGTYQDARRVSPRSYLQKYHRQASDIITSFCSKSCLHKCPRLIWYSNLPLTFLTATNECFYFGSSSFYFFEINGV